MDFGSKNEEYKKMNTALYSSVAFRHPFGLFKVIELAASYGYDAVDCRGFSLDVPIIEDRHVKAFGYDMIGPTTVDDRGVAALREEMEKRSLLFSCISCYNALTVSEGPVAADSQRRLKETIDFAAKLAIPVVRLIGYSEHPFTGFSLPRTDALNLLCTRLNLLCDYAGEKGIDIYIENSENIIPGSVVESLEIADRVQASNLGVVFDVINTYFEGNDPLEELQLFNDSLPAMVHVKNVKRTAQVQDDLYAPKTSGAFTWTLLSQGDVPIETILKTLVDRGFNGYVVGEYANPHKGMDRSYWNAIPDPDDWAKDAKQLFDRVVSSR